MWRYKDNLYMITGYTKMKHPETGEWIPAVNYQNQDGESFTREKKDFDNKFVRQWRE